ncbi:MAG: trypsin-like peptidase domain-containing protein [Acidobacteriota bacterium]
MNFPATLPWAAARAVRVASSLSVIAMLAGAAPAMAGQRPSVDSCQEPLSVLYKRVAPSVVAIASTTINPYDIDHRIEHASGSGVIIDASGLILTNSHVVFGRQLLTVTLDNGVTLPAQFVGADPQFDIAVIRIPKPTSGNLPVATLGDSERVLVGDDVYAIGNPLGLEQTLTRGIVSAVNRSLPGSSWSLTEPLIQTDAAINPGSSGGPLIDRCGAVIGITSANLPDAQSIGFAVPANLVRSVIPGLVTNGRVIRPWLGIQGQFVVPVLKELLRVPLVDGFLVEVVEPGSPAEAQEIHGGQFELVISGQPLLLGGDIITMVNGAQLDEPQKLAKVLGALKVGSTVSLTIVRDNKSRQVEVTLTERPLLPGDIPARRTAGTAMPASSRARQLF